MATQKPPLKVAIKVLAYDPKLSEETYNFRADVLVNGKLLAHASNAGHGGNTLVQRYGKLSENAKNNPLDGLWKEFEAYVAGLPPEVSDPDEQGNVLLGDNGKPFSYKLNVESYVDKLFDDYVRNVYIPKVETARYKRACKTKVVYTLHSDFGQGFEYEKKATLFNGFEKYKLQQQYGDDLKEIINERFLTDELKLRVAEQLERASQQPAVAKVKQAARA